MKVYYQFRYYVYELNYPEIICLTDLERKEHNVAELTAVNRYFCFIGLGPNI